MGKSAKQLMFFMGDSKMVSVLNLKQSHVSTEGSGWLLNTVFKSLLLHNIILDMVM